MKIWCFTLSTIPNNQSIKTESGWGSRSLNYMYVLQWMSAIWNKNRKLNRLFQVYIADISLLTSNRFVGLFCREKVILHFRARCTKMFLKNGLLWSKPQALLLLWEEILYNQLILQFFQDFDFNFWHLRNILTLWKPWSKPLFLIGNHYVTWEKKLSS